MPLAGDVVFPSKSQRPLSHHSIYVKLWPVDQYSCKEYRRSVESTAEDVLAFEQFNSICRKAEILRENLSVMLSKKWSLQIERFTVNVASHASITLFTSARFATRVMYCPQSV